MPTQTDDVRIIGWSLVASAGTTVSIEFTSPDALASLSIWTGGTVVDVDDLADATEYAATLGSTTAEGVVVGANRVATVALTVPTGSAVPLRLAVNGVVQTVGRLHPSTAGTEAPDNTITLTPEVNQFELTILGVVQTGGGGGGAPTDAGYLVTTAHVDLTGEVVVGATPGGELGGTWASPTVDATHAGSTHAAVQAAAEATAAAALASHEADTTSVHGIADTSVLETTSGAQAKADAKVTQTITNGVTTTAPSEDAVFDALALKAALASPALTGNPTAPTATQGDNDTSIATTAYVNAEIAADAYTPGGTDVAVVDGGTGASTAAGARTNLGVPADVDVVHDTGDETIAGVKTFSSDPLIPDEAYDATAWNGVLEPPTKNAVRDKIEDILDGVTFTGDVVVPDEAYDATAWNGSLEVPTKNAVRDKIETLGGGPPSGPAGGVLSGTYPDPGFAVDMATQAELDAKVSDTAYAGSWDAVTTVAPSKNAVYDQMELKAPLASPALTGNPTAPTPAAADNDTSIATTAFVQGELAAKAPLASPALTGNPTAPTPSAGDNDTSIATTAFVTAAVAATPNLATIYAFGG